MKKIVSLIKIVPWWSYVYAACFLLMQIIPYFIMGQVNGSRIGTDWALNVKIPAIDDKIPFIVNSSIFYFATYPFWFFAAIVVSRTSKQNIWNVSIGYVISILIGVMCFIFIPTYLDREAEGVYQAVNNPGATNFLMLFIYNNDGGTIGTNLFPSFHCLVSTYVSLAVLFEKNIKRGWKGFTVIAAILICISTLTTKQHYFLDVVSGVGIALVMFFLTKLINPARWIIKEKRESHN